MLKSKAHIESAEILIDFLLFMAGRYSDKSRMREYLADIFYPLVSSSASHLVDQSNSETVLFSAIINMPFHFGGVKGTRLATSNKQSKQGIFDVKDKDLYHAQRFAFGYFKCLSFSSDPNTAANKRSSGKPDIFHELAYRYQLTLYDMFKEHHTDLLSDTNKLS